MKISQKIIFSFIMLISLVILSETKIWANEVFDVVANGENCYLKVLKNLETFVEDGGPPAGAKFKIEVMNSSYSERLTRIYSER